MSERTAGGYRARRIVMARRQPGIVPAGEGFPPQPDEDLAFRGGRTLPRMSYKTFYVGASWAGGALAAARASLDGALAAAMTDPALNEIVGQYFSGAVIATEPLGSAILDLPVQQNFDKGDIHELAQRTFMSGALSGADLGSAIVNFVLPPTVVLSSDGGGALRIGRRSPPGAPETEEEDSRRGLGGYHGSIHVMHPGAPITVYYAVSVWSEGGNGIAIPGWAPWENACATLYHELNEARTDPDVEDAIRTGDLRWIGWNADSGDEIGDFPIEEAGSDLSLVFRKVGLADGSGTVPIQLLWSNRVHAPEAPGAPHLALPAPVFSLAAASAPAAVGAGIAFSAPGKLEDFKKPASAAGWSAFLSGFFDDSAAATQAYLKGLPSQFFNPAKGIPQAPDRAELPIKWPGFPRLLENSDLPPEEALRQAELISGTFIGRYRHQDEYLEWFVARDPASQKIVRIDFTCEGPEYWQFLAENEPDQLVALYQRHVAADAKAADLLHDGRYNPLNVWNTMRGAMHLIQPNNSLSAEIKIAADATILRKNDDGSLKTDAQDLIVCGQYGEPGRASDPHIGDLVNELARAGWVVSLKDPVGLYMSRPRLTGFATPDGRPVTQDWFTVTRGSEDYILHGVFAAPAGSPYVVGDIMIGGEPLAYGGQVAKVVDMGLTGVAYGKGAIKSPAFPCGGPRAAAAAMLTAGGWRIGRGR